MIYKYYKITNDDDKYKDKSPLSLELKRLTGFYANDYIKPVINKSGDIVTIITDESEFKGHFSSSLIILPNNIESYIGNYHIKKESELEKLVEIYGLKTIHFTEIFGKERILKGKRDAFLKDYSDIVREVPMICSSISKNRDVILNEMGVKEITNEDIFYSLLWTNIENIVSKFPNHSIYHIYTEQEYSLDNYHNVGKKIFNKLYAGIDSLSQRLPEKYISICKHPHFFSKKALFYSSLADLLAYGSNKLQNKIDSEINDNKIMEKYGVILRLFKSFFVNYSGLSSKMIELINKS